MLMLGIEMKFFRNELDQVNEWEWQTPFVLETPFVLRKDDLWERESSQTV